MKSTNLLTTFIPDQVHNQTYGSSKRSREKYGNIEPFLTPDLTRRHRKEDSLHNYTAFLEEAPRPKSALSLNKFQKFKDATR